MKILIASDIHANFFALQKLTKEINSSDYVFFLGDFVGYNTQVNETLEFIRSYTNIFCLMGNHDYYLINNIRDGLNENVIIGLDYAQKIITNENLNWLKSLSQQLCVNLLNKKILLQHGSPYNPLFEYIYPTCFDKITSMLQIDADIICLGHTHHPFIFKKNNKIILNPGSIGQPRDIRTSSSYMILNENMEIEHKRIEMN